jgi:predicted RNA-binding protein with PIN domain
MSYLIDGHNLIPKIPNLGLQDIDDEVQLIKVLQDFCRLRGKRVDVYFDNAPPGGDRTRNYGLVTAHFVRQGGTADAAIRSRLKKIGRSARNHTVITSDRAVAAASREAGARVISSDEFARSLPFRNGLGELAPEIDPDLSLSSGDIGDWMNLFGEKGGGE